MLAAVLHLGPAMFGAATWKGEGMTEDDAMPPGDMFLILRVIQLLFESLPELTLTLLLVLRGQSSWRVVASIAMSVASASFTMMDVSVGFERSRMVSREPRVETRATRSTGL